MEHPLETIVLSTMEQLKQLTAVDAVVGKPVHVSETTCVIPVSRVSLGFITGGGEYGVRAPVLESGFTLDSGNRPFPFAGTMTAGVALRPMAFLAITGESVRVLPVEENEPCARLAAMLPELMREAVSLIGRIREDTEK